MKSRLFLTATTVVLLSAVIAFQRIKIAPPASHIGEASSDKLLQFEALRLKEAVGPESFAFDQHGGGPYTGISDGRIIKWQQSEGRWINFATTSPQRDGCEGPHDHDQTEHICGRPLGLNFDAATGDLYVADAYVGLLVVGPSGGLATEVVTEAEGRPFGFTNSLDIDRRSGVVYFTDSSSQYRRRNYLSVILSGDRTGRLMKYEPRSKQVTVLLSNLSFPNGVLLSEDGHYILLAETGSCRILRYWLETSKAGILEEFAQLPGFPDNIQWSPRGGLWVAIASRREKIFERILSHPWIGNGLLKLPLDITKAYSRIAKWKGGGLAVRVGEEGKILEIFEDRSGNRWTSIAEVLEKNGTLWVGSINAPYAGKYKI